MRILKQFVLYVLIGFAAFFLQTTLMPRIQIASIAPNLLVIVTAIFGAVLDTRKGMYMGFLCGIWCDIFYGSFLGLYALIYVFIGYAAGTIKRRVFDDDVNLPVLIILTSDVLYGLIMYVLFYFLRTRFHFFFYLGHVILPEAVYTGLLGVLLYRIFLMVQKRREANEKRRANKFV